MKTTDRDWAVGDGYSRIHYNKEYDFHSGSVVTPHGIVDVYAQGDARHSHITRVDFVYWGRCYSRYFRGKRYTPRGMVTKAKQFAAEIAEQAA